MRPDHVPPDPRLAKRTAWEWVDDPEHGRIVRVWSPSYDQWSRQLAWTGIVHERLDAQEGFEAIVAAVRRHDERLDEDRARSKVGTYLYSLWVDGVVDLGFPPAPAWFTDTIETRKELGRGGVGVAWLCHDHAGDRPVVVKHAWDFFHPIDTMDRLIRKEAEVFQALEHPGILRLYETFERDGLLHMVREFVDGQELHMAAQEPTFDLGRAARDLVEILQHVHERGLLLLDMRPANFFLPSSDRTVVLVDVGNCVAHDGGTVKLKKAMGSPAFSAPEVRKRRASTASDAYGLGRLLFTLASGRPPLPKWGQMEMREALKRHPLAAIIVALCADDPDERPSLDDVRKAV